MVCDDQPCVALSPLEVFGTREQTVGGALRAVAKTALTKKSTWREDLAILRHEVW
jgi:hypothetical protein